jgi:hypothetical protein
MIFIDNIKENNSKMRLFNHKVFVFIQILVLFGQQEKMVIKNVERLVFKIAEKCVSAFFEIIGT